MIRILLDEHVSPSLVGKLGDKGVFAVAATHVGLSGEPDAKIWNYAFENDFVVVTGNARDFIRLLNVEVHPGLIVLREGGLTREEQWVCLAKIKSACEISNIQRHRVTCYMDENRLVRSFGEGQRCALRSFCSLFRNVQLEWMAL